MNHLHIARNTSPLLGDILLGKNKNLIELPGEVWNFIGDELLPEVGWVPVGEEEEYPAFAQEADGWLGNERYVIVKYRAGPDQHPLCDYLPEILLRK